jgi:hypothetical protein
MFSHSGFGLSELEGLNIRKLTVGARMIFVRPDLVGLLAEKQ